MQGEEWEEKWGEQYEPSGHANKWADKWAKKGPEIWHEKWGEDYNGQGSCMKYTDKVGALLKSADPDNVAGLSHARPTFVCDGYAQIVVGVAPWP